MRRFAILLFFTGLFTTAYSQSNTSTSTGRNRLPVLNKTGVGVLELGMKVDDIYKYINKEQVFKVYTYDGNGRKTSYQIYTPDKKTQIFAADLNCESGTCIISRIIVWHKAYPTVRNVRVGQSFKDIRENYRVNDILWMDGNLRVETMEGITFYIDTQTLPESYIKGKRFLNLPPAARISAMMVQL